MYYFLSYLVLTHTCSSEYLKEKSASIGPPKAQSDPKREKGKERKMEIARE
jgi:hypothetical protein